MPDLSRPSQVIACDSLQVPDCFEDIRQINKKYLSVTIGTKIILGGMGVLDGFVYKYNFRKCRSVLDDFSFQDNIKNLDI